MNLQEMYNNIDKFAEEQNKAIDDFYKEQPSEETPVVGSGPTDLYQRNMINRRENSKKNFPKGSSRMVMAATKTAIDGGGKASAGLACAYARAKSDSEVLRNSGEFERYEMIRQQYMEERFLPAVELVVNLTSPDEVLNCAGALDAFDKYVLVAGSGKGYTASYIRGAYGGQLGKKIADSDPSVIEAIIGIKRASRNDNIRTAVGIAKRIKKAIDSGEVIASDDDYAIIGRVAAYAG